MDYKGYAAMASGVITGMIAMFTGILFGDVIGGIFSGVCFFVFGMAAFSKVSDMIETYKAVQAWERHHSREIDFRVGRPIPTMPGYVEVDL